MNTRRNYTMRITRSITMWKRWRDAQQPDVLIPDMIEVMMTLKVLALCDVLYPNPPGPGARDRQAAQGSGQQV